MSGSNDNHALFMALEAGGPQPGRQMAGCLSVVSSHGREESERGRERKERERERASASSPGSSYEGANPIHEDVTLVT